MTYFTKLKTTVPLSESEIKDSLTAYGDGRIEFLKFQATLNSKCCLLFLKNINNILQDRQ